MSFVQNIVNANGLNVRTLGRNVYVNGVHVLHDEPCHNVSVSGGVIRINGKVFETHRGTGPALPDDTETVSMEGTLPAALSNLIVDRFTSVFVKQDSVPKGTWELKITCTKGTWDSARDGKKLGQNGIFDFSKLQQVRTCELTIVLPSKLPVRIDQLRLVSNHERECHVSVLAESGPGIVCTNAHVSVVQGRIKLENVHVLRNLDVRSSSADIVLDHCISSHQASLTSASGNISLTGIQYNTIFLTSASGDVQVTGRRNVHAGDGAAVGPVKLVANTMSGDICLSEVRLRGSFSLFAMSGDVIVQNENDSVEHGNLAVRTLSGDILLRQVFLRSPIEAESTSGDLTGRGSAVIFTTVSGTNTYIVTRPT